MLKNKLYVYYNPREGWTVDLGESVEPLFKADFALEISTETTPFTVKVIKRRKGDEPPKDWVGEILKRLERLESYITKETPED
jgi:hypothetical protein